MKSIKSFRVIFGLVVAIMLLISYFTYQSLDNMIQDAEDVAHTNVVMRELEKVISEVKDAESSHRGYQLTNDSAYLEPYFNSKWIALSKIDLVDSLTTDNTTQQGRLDSLRVLVQNQYSIIEQILYDMRDKDRFEEKENQLISEGNNNMNKIRDLVDDMSDLEWKLLIRRTDRQDYSSMMTPLLIFMSFILAIIAIAYLFTQLYKTLRIKIVAEEELEQNLKQISQEVNEKMRARESLRKVLDSSPNGILFMEAVREDGKIVDFQYVLGNRAVERLLQKPLENIIGNKLLSSFPNSKKSGSFDSYVETIEKGVPNSMEILYQENGREIWIEESCVKLEDGCVVTLVDTSVHKKANRIIEESRKKFEAIFNNTFQFISLLDYRGVLLETNEAMLSFGHFNSEDILGKSLWDISWWTNSSQIKDDIKTGVERAQRGEFVRYEANIIDDKGEEKTVDFSLKPISGDEGVNLIIFEGRDITELKEAEEEKSFVSDLNLTIARSDNFDQAVKSVFEQISERFNIDYAEVWLPYDGQMYLSELFYATESSFGELHNSNLRLDVNRGEGMIGRVMTSHEMEFIDDLSSATADEFIKGHNASEYGLKNVFAVPILFNNELILTAAFFARESSGNAEDLRGTIRQVSSSIGALLIKKKTQDDIEKNNKILASAEGIANMGSWEWYLPKNTIKWSTGVYKIFERSEQKFTPTYASFLENHVHPEDMQQVKTTIEEAKANNTGYDITFRVILDHGKIKHLRVLATYELDELGKVETFYGAIQDITQQKSFEYNLLIKNEELSKSNENLEQFAYVASHDLQEPLRKIRAFGDRLVSKYESVLEERGADYISRMQGAAARMQSLIDDLLKYSRVARNQEPFKQIDLNELIDDVQQDIEARITETNAKVEVDKLPTIDGDAVQLRQLFQNLISNAIKFTPPERTPLVEVSANIIGGGKVQKKYNFNTDSTKQFAEIKIKDNGIGFDKKYSERIFNIFERLHGRNEFQGTGIGLAICQKVVQNHNGLIIADGEEGTGAIFTIVVPLKNNEND
ncbi:CHASE3 domain-containing protein [Fulvivirga ligni]|uniref:CHASE3 domain-containing protein n=1 Tax=Fulvivirga ligni TaxID=2904246 RepID=UPI001F3E4A97|nr:CHASE3 domain-containing protein [Fulvivirga ligni]UII20040.1 CHASE3 domain-containing protein [Fulvivirga ligni]